MFLKKKHMLLFNLIAAWSISSRPSSVRTTWPFINRLFLFALTLTTTSKKFKKKLYFWHKFLGKWKNTKCYYYYGDCCGGFKSSSNIFFLGKFSLFQYFTKCWMPLGNWTKNWQKQSHGIIIGLEHFFESEHFQIIFVPSHNLSSFHQILNKNLSYYSSSKVKFLL